jgi:hypothetical protein
MFTVNYGAALFVLLVAICGTYLIQQSHSRSLGYPMGWGHAMQGILYALTLRHLTSIEKAEAIRTMAILCSEVEDLDFEPDSLEPRSSHTALISPLLCEIAQKASASRPSGLDSMWTPHIIAFFAMPNDRIQYPQVLSLIAQLSTRGGLCVLAHVVIPDTDEPSTEKSYESGCGLELNPKVRHSGKHLDWEGNHGVDEDCIPIESTSVTYDVDFASSESTILRRTLILQRAASFEKDLAAFVKVFACTSVRMGQAVLLQTIGLGTPCCILNF